MRIEGNLMVFGDLILEDHAVREFVVPQAEAAIYGKGVQGDGVRVSGSFGDLQNAYWCTSRTLTKKPEQVSGFK